MITYKFSCPYCQQHFCCDDRLANAQIECANCKQPIVVPPPPAPKFATVVQPATGHTWDTHVPKKVAPENLNLKLKPGGK